MRIDLAPGEIRTVGRSPDSKVKYCCSRGHEFEDLPPESDRTPGFIIDLDKPERLRGRYCGLCFQELIGRVVPAGEPVP